MVNSNANMLATQKKTRVSTSALVMTAKGSASIARKIMAMCKLMSCKLIRLFHSPIPNTSEFERFLLQQQHSTATGIMII